MRVSVNVNMYCKCVDMCKSACSMMNDDDDDDDDDDPCKCMMVMMNDGE